MTTHLPFAAPPADPPLAASRPPAIANVTVLPILSRLAVALGRQAAREQFSAISTDARVPAIQPEAFG